MVLYLGSWVLLDVQFSLVKGLAGGDPITEHSFLGRKLVISQKHKRSRMHKGVICWIEGSENFYFIPRRRKKRRGAASLKHISRLRNQAGRSSLPHWFTGPSTKHQDFSLQCSLMAVRANCLITSSVQIPFIFFIQ